MEGGTENDNNFIRKKGGWVSTQMEPHIRSGEGRASSVVTEKRWAQTFKGGTRRSSSQRAGEENRDANG